MPDVYDFHRILASDYSIKHFEPIGTNHFSPHPVNGSHFGGLRDVA